MHRLGGQRQRLHSHHIRLPLQPRVNIHSQPTSHLQRRLHSPLRLLHHMPRLMRQVPLLPRRYMDVTALRVAQGVELGGLFGVVVDTHVVHGQAGQGFDAALELVGQAGVVGTGRLLQLGLKLCGGEFPLDKFFFLWAARKLGHRGESAIGQGLQPP